MSRDKQPILPGLKHDANPHIHTMMTVALLYPYFFKQKPLNLTQRSSFGRDAECLRVHTLFFPSVTDSEPVQ